MAKSTNPENLDAWIAEGQQAMTVFCEVAPDQGEVVMLTRVKEGLVRIISIEYPEVD